MKNSIKRLCAVSLVIMLLTSCAVSNTNTPKANNEDNIQTNAPAANNEGSIRTNEPAADNEDNIQTNDPGESNEDNILTYDPKAYNVDNILQTIAEITSEEFCGRGAGTPGGRKTEEYFSAKFKEIGLKPGGDNNTYYQAFNGVKGDTVGPYILEVVDGDKVIKTYKYGTDYKLLARFPCSGEITASGKLVEEASADMPRASGEIALLRNYPNSNSTDPRILIDLNNAGYGGVISLGGETINRVKGQSGYYGGSDVPEFPGVSVSRPVFDELINYSDNGYNIHLAANFVVSDYSANNVIGVLEAAEPTEECLVVSGPMHVIGELAYKKR